jgi:hypothetical protein
MELTKEEFEEQFSEGQNQLLEIFANDPEIDLEKFDSIACFFENLTFFRGVIYDLLKKNNKEE